MEVETELIKHILQRLEGVDIKLDKLMQNPLDGRERRISEIRSIIEKRGTLSMTEIRTEFGVSKTYALELMKEIAKEPFCIFAKGSPHSPSRLIKKTAENEVDFIVEWVKAYFRDKPVGATMSTGHISNTYGITDEGKLQDIVSKAVIGYSLKVQKVQNPLSKGIVERRIIKVR